MNPSAREFIPITSNPVNFPMPHLSNKQTKIAQELLNEWTSTPTLNSLHTRWEKRRRQTEEMINVQGELTILMLNISSLRLHLYDLFELLSSLHPSILVLNGTRHDEAALKLLTTHLNSFQVFYQEGSNDFGGVLIAIHRSIPAQRVNNFANVRNIIVLDIGNSSSSNKLQIATCYSPPSEKLPMEHLTAILRRSPNTILLGDLNAKHESWSRSAANPKGRLLNDWLTVNQLQVVNKFTPTSTRSTAVIDIILAPSSSCAGNATILPTIGSDHFPIFWASRLAVPLKDRVLPVKRTYWPVYEIFITFTSNYWDKVYSSTSDKTTFFHLYEQFLSLALARVTYVSYCNAYRPALPPHIVSLVQLKRNYLARVRKKRHPLDIQTLNQLTKCIRTELFAHKRRSWYNYCNSLNSCDIKQFWRRSRRHFSPKNPCIDGLLLQDGTTITTTAEMCDTAKQFYQEQFSEHVNSQTQLEKEAETLNDELNIVRSNVCLNFAEIKLADVRKAISTMKNKNSAGPDGVSNRIIKMLPTPHLVFITRAFNHMAKHASFPKHWLTAKMVLLSKTKSSIVELKDTRPISLLPCFSKLYEKIFLTNFRKWIEDNAILPQEQTGFRPRHNMATRTVAIIDQIGQGLIANTATAGLFIDYQAAFNQLWFQGLWVKLKRLNCPLQYTLWLKAYLQDRTAFIEMKNTKSKQFPLYKGVPQGSCVGPVLFILYNHDILDGVSNLHFKHLFADDLAVILSPSATWPPKMVIPQLRSLLSEVIEYLVEYSSTWKQPINYKKTYWTLFHRRIAPPTREIHCANVVIAHTPKIKYLGIHLDARLAFTAHLDHIKSKINRNLAVFKRLASCRMLSDEVSSRLYHAYIRPYLQTILNIYPVLAHNKQQQMEALNRRIYRVIHRWPDARNNEVMNFPSYKSIEMHTRKFFDKVMNATLTSNPMVIEDYMQFKMYRMYLSEYIDNPLRTKDRGSTMNRGRRPKRIRHVIATNRRTLLDEVLCFNDEQ